MQNNPIEWKNRKKTKEMYNFLQAKNSVTSAQCLDPSRGLPLALGSLLKTKRLAGSITEFCY